MKEINRIMVTSEQEIINTIKIAKDCHKTVHCYSAGFNWGYGTCSPIDENSLHLDLSNMNAIKSFDKDLGILTIEPGVTQGLLFDYLKKNNLDFYVPTTGAGRRGSIVGNALERGIGIAPIQDHASSILSVRGILSDGSIYESALKEIDPKLADCFNWGIGPNLDKMISQSSWIIVTEVSLQLKRKSECIDLILMPFSDKEFEQIISCIQKIMSEDEGHIGSIKIFNRKQILNETNSKINQMIFKNHEWFMTIVIYSHSITRLSLLKLYKSKIQKYSQQKITVFNEKKINLTIFFMSLFPSSIMGQNLAKLKDFKEVLKLSNGEVSEVGLKALDGQFDYSKNDVFDFKNFKRELIWLSPICPLDPISATRLLSFIKNLEHHDHFKFNTLTWTVVNQRTLALVIPIIYEKCHETSFWEWYKELHLKLKAQGFIPYRFHNQMMETVRSQLLPRYFIHIDKFEKAMDPESILFNGRYSNRVRSSSINLAILK
jgi:hypothetical protein